MNLFVRHADTGDCALIRDIASRIWEPAYGSILSKEQLIYMFEMMYSVESLHRQMTVEQHHYMLLYVDDAPSGYLSIERKSDDLFIYQKIYVLPTLHGQGLGRYLFNQGIEYIRSCLHPDAPFTIELYVNRANPAVDFYLHLGMSIVDTRDHYIGNDYYMNDYVMQIHNS
ncbi:MAG: GNAT family N-acetyltransferase [Tannerella sp.]|jgi:GNAT superfamily N-acetyltransferase|nr:GNAT family N-acetyltransferase [Tannerella sp.]